MQVTIKQIREANQNVSPSFIYKVLAPIQTGTKVVGMGLSNVYNASLLDYAINKYLDRVERSKSNARHIQMRTVKSKLEELRKAVESACKQKRLD